MDNSWGCLYQDRRLTNKITGRILVCIELEALGLFVLLSLGNETSGIAETFLNRSHPNFFRQVSNLCLGVSLFFLKFIPFFVILFLLSFVKLQHNTV